MVEPQLNDNIKNGPFNKFLQHFNIIKSTKWMKKIKKKMFKREYSCKHKSFLWKLSLENIKLVWLLVDNWIRWDYNDRSSNNKNTV